MSRDLLPSVVIRIAPGALAVLFGLSQLTAIIDFSVIRSGLRDLSWISGWLVVSVLGTVIGLGARSPVQGALDQGLPWLRTLPLTPSHLAMGLLPLGVGATLVTWLLLPVLGPWYGPGVLVGASVVSLAAAAGAWWSLAAAALGTGLGPLGMLLVPFLLHDVGGALRRRHPRSTPPTRALRMNNLLLRDLIGLTRHASWWTPVQLLGLGIVGALVQVALRRGWTPEEQTLGALIQLGFIGWIPWWCLGRAAQVFGPHLLDRSLPVSPSQRVLELWTLAMVPLLPWALGITLVGTGTGIFGLARCWLAVACFGGLAVLSLVLGTESSRRSIQGTGIFATTALTVGAFALGPRWMLVQLLAVIAVFIITNRRIRCTP